MDYSSEAFEALVQEVEAQGGAMLPDSCMPQNIEYKKEDGYKKPKVYKKITCGCKNESRLVSVYDNGLKSTNGSGFVTLCAVCDSVGAQPRYLKAVVAADPDINPIEHDEDDEDDEDA